MNSLAIAQTYPLPAAPDVMHHRHAGREGLVQRSTVFCRSLDNCTSIPIWDLTNEKRERLHHHYNDVSYSPLIGQSEIRMFLRLSSDLQRAVVVHGTRTPCACAKWNVVGVANVLSTKITTLRNLGVVTS